MDAFDAPAEDTAIAIIGMAGRFPGAPDIAALRAMLMARGSGIIRLAPGEDPTGQAGQPGYVPARGVLDGAEFFDAALFGIAPRDAAMMDPQQRVFLECCWAALEDAGHAPQGPGCATAGVFASASMATHWLGTAAAAGLSGLGGIAAVDKDMLAGRVAYHLGLGGPAVGVQTACSSSLVGVHLAVQALIAGECDLALAGGVSVTVPLRAGYLHQPGGVMSPDGDCRPYTAEGRGTVKGDGAAVVVLRRLADALAEGETIRAVILGSAVTNDGRQRAGFAAPGLGGQARAIRQALQVAGLPARAIGFVEGHGTATQVGDAIELRALAETFGPARPGDEPPVLGSAKAHLGHMDAAAGVVGLIKAVLAVEAGVIPPALRAGPPHPDLAASGFVLADEARAWPRRDGPRRAGVSSFGLGGTNAHLVIEQAPPPPVPTPAPGPHTLVLSARTRDGLAAQMAALRDHLRAHPRTALADIAHTLAQGRTPQPWRLSLTVHTTEEAAEALAGPAPEAAADLAWPAPAPARRIPLPGTRFERVRHWLDAAPTETLLPEGDRLLAAGWHALPPPPAVARGAWLVIATGRRGATLTEQMRRAGAEARLAETPAEVASIAAAGFRPDHVLHATALAEPPPGGFLAAQMQGAAGLPGWVQALAMAGFLPRASLLIAASHATGLGGEKRLRPEHAGLLAAPATLMAEHPGLRAAFVDLGETEDLAACLLAEAAAPEPVVAWRHGRRWARDWQVVQAAPAAPLRAQGVWLVTGGTGGIGLLVAEHLARRAQARLLLAGRDIARPAVSEAMARIAAAGGLAECVAADLEAPGAAAGLVARALDRFGALHGVVHAAGRGEGGMVQRLAPEAVLAHLAVKPAAALDLAAALAGRPLDRFLLCGSHAGAFGAFGQYGYAVANAALAGVAEALCAGGLRSAVAVHWDRWRGTGMAVLGEARHREVTGADLPGGLSPAEALALFDRALDAPPGLAGLLATSRPVAALLAERQGGGAAVVAPPSARQPRPAGLPPAVPPATPTETALVDLWEGELGIAPVGTADVFVALGGDSLNALRVAGAAQARLGIALPLRLLMEDGTIAGIAARLDAGEARAAAPPDSPSFIEDAL